MIRNKFSSSPKKTLCNSRVNDRNKLIQQSTIQSTRSVKSIGSPDCKSNFDVIFDTLRKMKKHLDVGEQKQMTTLKNNPRSSSKSKT